MCLQSLAYAGFHRKLTREQKDTGRVLEEAFAKVRSFLDLFVISYNSNDTQGLLQQLVSNQFDAISANLNSFDFLTKIEELAIDFEFCELRKRVDSIKYNKIAGDLMNKASINFSSLPSSQNDLKSKPRSTGHEQLSNNRQSSTNMKQLVEKTAPPYPDFVKPNAVHIQFQGTLGEDEGLFRCRHKEDIQNSQRVEPTPQFGFFACKSDLKPKIEDERSHHGIWPKEGKPANQLHSKEILVNDGNRSRLPMPKIEENMRGNSDYNSDAFAKIFAGKNFDRAKRSRSLSEKSKRDVSIRQIGFGVSPIVALNESSKLNSSKVSFGHSRGGMMVQNQRVVKKEKPLQKTTLLQHLKRNNLIITHSMVDSEENSLSLTMNELFQDKFALGISMDDSISNFMVQAEWKQPKSGNKVKIVDERPLSKQKPSFNMQSTVLGKATPNKHY